MEQTFNFVNVKDIRGEVTEFKSDYKRLLKKYNDAATQYAYDVLFTDKYITGRDVQLACIRHLNDLKRIGDDDFPYHYDIKMVAAIEWFCRLLPNPDNTSKNLEPMKWQSFILDNLIGWRSESNGTRYTDANISVARRNGKTFIASVLMNFYYFMVCWNATSADLLVASYDRDHCQKLFDDVALQARQLVRSEEFADESKERDVQVQTTQIVSKNTKNDIVIGYSEGNSSFDSRHNVIAIYDEIGNLRPAKNGTLKEITSGQNGINNALFVKISTAYPNLNAKFKSDEDSMRAEMEKDDVRSSDDTFQVIYCQDSEDEVFAPETWAKSNPNLIELSEKSRNELFNSLVKDKDKNEREGTLVAFVNKTLNLWTKQNNNSFLSYGDIEKNIIKDFDIKNRKVYIGFDASQSNDNTSFGFIFPYENKAGEMKLFAMQHSFIPFAAAKTLEVKCKQDGLDYLKLEKQGYCTITDLKSGVINKNQVYNWLIDFVEQNNLKVEFVVCDPNLASWFKNKIEHYQPTWNLMDLRPTSFYLSNTTKDFQNRFINGDFNILNDPLLIDGLNNAVLIEDRGGGVKIDRQNNHSDHIDTTDALINAHDRAQYAFESFSDEHVNPLNDMDKKQQREFFKTMFGGVKN